MWIIIVIKFMVKGTCATFILINNFLLRSKLPCKKNAIPKIHNILSIPFTMSVL